MKPGTFTQIYVQIVFAVKNREALLHSSFRERIFEYMGGILTEMKHKSLIVNGMPDHVHMLIGLNPNISISETVHSVKRSTSLLINNEKLCRVKFAWQEGYGAFTYGRSQLNDVYHYVKNQEKHHKRLSFKEEYVAFLKKFEVDYDERFLFDFFDEETL